MKRQTAWAVLLRRLLTLFTEAYDDHQRKQKQQRRAAEEQRKQAIEDNPDDAWNKRFGVRDHAERD